MQKAQILIDGSVLEGGGQILRNVSALSAIFGLPIRVDNIRAGRDKPGLRPQHLSGLKLISQLCNGQLEGGTVGSVSITLSPGEIIAPPESLRIDTGTAGSVALLIQTAVPCLAFSTRDTNVELIGGTDAEHAPPIDFMYKAFKPYGEKFGLKIDIVVKQRGYYPRGGGRVVLSSTSIHHLRALEMLNQGHVRRVFGRSWVAGNLPAKLASDCKKTAVRALKSSKLLSGAEFEIEDIQESKQMAPFGTANGIELYAETDTGCIISSSILGRKGYSAEEMGTDAADKLVANLKNGECVDEYMQDQVVIFMALAKGHSRIRTGPPTLHTKTAILMAEIMTDSRVKFSHKPATDNLGGYILEATGIGFENVNLKN